jgi:hypothetical protein
MPAILILSFLIGTRPVERTLDPALRSEIEARIAIVRGWAADPVVVEAVRAANENPRPMSEIQAIDETWQETFGVDDFMHTIIDHPAAMRLKELRKSNPELQEAFATDCLGALVAATNKTSDFYQGDEEKFTEAFVNGEGGVHMGTLARDESIQAYAVPIGVPIMDEDRVIGVLVVTVNVEKLQKMMESK